MNARVFQTPNRPCTRGIPFAVAIVLTPARRQLRTPGPYLAAAIAAALFLPHVLWQMAHGWP
jgi:hypothetical protein